MVFIRDNVQFKAAALSTGCNGAVSGKNKKEKEQNASLLNVTIPTGERNQKKKLQNVIKSLIHVSEQEGHRYFLVNYSEGGWVFGLESTVPRDEEESAGRVERRTGVRGDV